MDTLTREAIEAMLAGPELDAWVSLHILGTRTKTDSAGEHWERREGRPWEAMPRYSNDIAAAWEVAELLHDTHPGIHIWPAPFVRPRIWYCEVGDHSAAGNSAPLAICRAALLTLLLATPVSPAPAVPASV